ncbi:MAG: hypothetical protein MJ230_01550 [bacterium]|nr:hypothetical protein [bacterium]
MATTISFNVKDVVDTSLQGNDFLDALYDYLKSVQVINNYFKIDTMNDSSGKYTLYLLPLSNATSDINVPNVALSICQGTNVYVNGIGGNSAAVTDYNISLSKNRMNFTFYFSDNGDCMVVARDLNSSSNVINMVFAETENNKTEGLSIKKSGTSLRYSYAQDLTGSITRSNVIVNYSKKYLIRVSTNYDIFKNIFFAINNIADTSPYELDEKKYVEFDVDNTKIGVAMLYE